MFVCDLGVTVDTTGLNLAPDELRGYASVRPDELDSITSSRLARRVRGARRSIRRHANRAGQRRAALNAVPVADRNNMGRRRRDFA